MPCSSECWQEKCKPLSAQDATNSTAMSILTQASTYASKENLPSCVWSTPHCFNTSCLHCLVKKHACSFLHNTLLHASTSCDTLHAKAQMLPPLLPDSETAAALRGDESRLCAHRPRNNMPPLIVGEGKLASIPCIPSACAIQVRAERFFTLRVLSDLSASWSPAILTQIAAKPQNNAQNSRCALAEDLPARECAKMCDPIKAPMTCVAVFSAEAPPESKP